MADRVAMHLDVESRSAVDLRKEGAYRYWRHPTTSVTVACYAFGDGPVHTWWPGEPCPREIREHVKAGGQIKAFNSQFERLAWQYYFVMRCGWPMARLEQFYCVAALARARGWPGQLDKACRFGGLAHQKDMDGHRLMLKLCRPRGFEADGTPIWWDDPADMERLGAYCADDVEAERDLDRVLLPLSDWELADFHLSERINDRGVRVDLALARKAVLQSHHEHVESNRTLDEVTGGAVTAYTQVQRILEWIADVWIPLPNLNKGPINELLNDPDVDIPDDVRLVLDIRLSQAKAAVSKFQAMLSRHIDGYLRGMYLFRGAGQTGRFSSMGVQIHNLLRESMPRAIPVFMKHGFDGLRLLGNPVQVLAKMVRPTFIPADGNVFLVGDYAAIEARVAAWLAGAQWLLKAFEEGRDVYCEFATLAFGRTITKADIVERQVGKACILGLCFGGAEGALARSLKQANITLPLTERKRLVQLYRREFAPEIVRYWRVLEDSAMTAMVSPGAIIGAGPLAFLFDGTHLWCKLPSGRVMCYPFAEIVPGKFDKDVIAYRRGNRSPKAGAYEWPTVELWYGILIENASQAIALDQLMGAMRRLGAQNIRMHTHDEAVKEVRREDAEAELPKFIEIMEQKDDWAFTLPVKVEGIVTERYGK